MNLKNIVFMKYDFNRDMIVEVEKKENISKIEYIINNIKNETSLDKEKDERLSFFSNKNKKTQNNNNITNKDIKNELKLDNKKSIANQKELIEKKIYEALNKHKVEPPIKRLKLFSYICYIFIFLIGTITIILDLVYIGRIKKNLNLINNTIIIKYCSFISIYYLRELSILNWNISGVEGFESYTNIPAKNKSEYIILLKEKLLELFLENQSSMKVLYSSLYLSNNSTRTISEYNLSITVSNTRKIRLNSTILTSLLMYNSAFYNLASTSATIDKDHSDFYFYIYNNLNSFKRAINILIDTFSNELEICNKEIKYIIIFINIFNFICLLFFIYLFGKNFFSAVYTRINYMKIFYGINDNILKKIIANCENLLNKLRFLEEQMHHEGESLSDNNTKFYIKKKDKDNIDNYNLNEGINNRMNDSINFTHYMFVILYVIYILIFYVFCIFKGVYMLKISNLSILKSLVCNKKQDIQLGLIDYFNVYREFLLEDNITINNLIPLEYLYLLEKRELITLGDNMNFIKVNINKVYPKNENRSEIRDLCNYYINEYFDSSIECVEKIGLITKYDFNTLTINFIEEININRAVMVYILRRIGNITTFNMSDSINIRKRAGKGELYTLSLFNNETLHSKLNIIYFSIILPYIQEDRQEINKILIIGQIEYFLSSLTGLFGLIISFLFFCYFVPLINYINSIIYKTKNMLSIIPLSILSYQTDVLILFSISNDKK